MADIRDYEVAVSQRSKSLAAIRVSRTRSSKGSAWAWAYRAADHAVLCGVKTPRQLLGTGKYPEVDALKEAIEKAPVLNTVELLQRVRDIARDPSNFSDECDYPHEALDEIVSLLDQAIAKLVIDK